MYAVIYSEGCMTHIDIRKECKTWIPLLSYNNKVLLFDLESTAKAFVKRNIPKDQVRGCIHLTNADLTTITNFEIITFPRKLSNFEPYIHYLDSEPEFKYS